MGGNSSSSLQQLGALFPGAGTGYQQTPIAPISAPQYGGALQPSPEQAAAATVARMQARTPMAAPALAPVQNKPMLDRGGNGDSHGRGSGGAW